MLLLVTWPLCLVNLRTGESDSDDDGLPAHYVMQQQQEQQQRNHQQLTAPPAAAASSSAAGRGVAAAGSSAAAAAATPSVGYAVCAGQQASLSDANLPDDQAEEAAAKASTSRQSCTSDKALPQRPCEERQHQAAAGVYAGQRQLTDPAGEAGGGGDSAGSSSRCSTHQDGSHSNNASSFVRHPSTSQRSQVRAFNVVFGAGSLQIAPAVGCTAGTVTSQVSLRKVCVTKPSRWHF